MQPGQDSVPHEHGRSSDTASQNPLQCSPSGPGSVLSHKMFEMVWPVGSVRFMSAGHAELEST
eukprot:scaffold265040_cov28-Tisochrysis_lutea.AAC.3